MPSSRGIFPTQGSNLKSLMSPALTGRFFIISATWEALICYFSTDISDSLDKQDRDIQYIKWSLLAGCGWESLEGLEPTHITLADLASFYL